MLCDRASKPWAVGASVAGTTRRGVEERKEAEEQKDASDEKINNSEEVHETDVVVGGG
jgi:hypothetical protein